MLSITRYHDICTGHRVYGHEGKCKNLHGHGYRIHFTCTANTLDSLGRIIDFSVVKEKLCAWLDLHWDHRTILWVEDPLVDVLCRTHAESVWVGRFNPTAENMAQFLLDTVGPKLLIGTGVTLTRVRVEETPKCSAEASL